MGLFGKLGGRWSSDNSTPERKIGNYRFLFCADSLLPLKHIICYDVLVMVYGPLAANRHHCHSVVLWFYRKVPPISTLA